LPNLEDVKKEAGIDGHTKARSPHKVEQEQDERLYKKKNLWITSRQNKDLKTLKQTSGLNQSEHMRRALDQYLAVQIRKGEITE
jgi:hypothetical protein